MLKNNRSYIFFILIIGITQFSKASDVQKKDVQQKQNQLCREIDDYLDQREWQRLQDKTEILLNNHKDSVSSCYTSKKNQGSSVPFNLFKSMVIIAGAGAAAVVCSKIAKNCGYCAQQ